MKLDLRAPTSGDFNAGECRGAIAKNYVIPIWQ